MSKGSPIVTLRIPRELLEKIDAAAALVDRPRAYFIVDAVRQKLAHRERANRQIRPGGKRS